MLRNFFCEAYFYEDDMNTQAPVKLAKGTFRCKGCNAAVPAKLGNWFISREQSSQQFFSCKKCEELMKEDYKRAIPIR